MYILNLLGEKCRNLLKKIIKGIQRINELIYTRININIFVKEYVYDGNGCF
jgi:hypothetical protein